MTLEGSGVYRVDDPGSMLFLLPAVLGAGIGFLAWPYAIWLAPLSLLLLPVVSRKHWLSPFVLMLGYHLATTCGLIRGTSDFFLHAGLLLGIAFWSITSLLFALPYLAYPYIARYFRGGGLGAVVATLLTSMVSTVLPPLGIVGWTSPWIGALSSGWFGILLVVLTIYALGRWADDGFIWQPISFCILFLWMTGFGLPALAAASMAARAPTLPPIPREMLGGGVPRKVPPHGCRLQGWVGVNTHLGRLYSGLSYINASMQMVPKVLQDLRSGDKVVLLPEGIAGPWLPGTQAVWQPVIRYTGSHPGQTVLLGAAVPLAGRKPHGRGYLDALVKIHDGHQKILPDHIPVPFSMWHPWQPRGNFRMAPFSRKPETTEISSKKVGYLICYEQLLIWPALDLYPTGIKVLLAPANDWWARGTDIPAIQRASAKAWGAFLGVPVLFAVNQ